MSEASPDEPLFSILLPTYNRAEVLEYAIRSVLAQSIQDFELLVVGDGCTDNTGVVVQSFNDPRICWFDLPKGPGFGYANRNVALRQARGRLIAFLAHDDLWFSDHLEVSAAGFADPATEFVYTCPMYVGRQGAITPHPTNLQDTETLNLFMARMQNVMPAACVSHRRACFDAYGYWNDGLRKAADYDMWVRIIEGGGRGNFAFIPVPTCLHFQADWRAHLAGPLEMKLWRRLIQVFKPQAAQALTITMPMGISEQASAWQMLTTDPAWQKAVRQAVSETSQSALWRSLHFTRAIKCRLAPPGTVRHRWWRSFSNTVKPYLASEN